MIICVTSNVAIDHTMTVPDYGLGGVFRPQSLLVVAGGKGINVARAIKTLGGEPLCAGFLGGYSGQSAAHMLNEEGLQAHWTQLQQGETRTCVILVDPQREQTSVINQAGPQVTDEDWQHLRDDLNAISTSARYICFCGSLPPGTTEAAFRETLTELVQHGNAVWVDGSGLALQIAAAVPGVHLKINDEEAGSYLHMPVEHVEDVLKAGGALYEQTGASVIITMGARGAIYIDAQQRLLVRPPQIETVSAVGSGDSFLAGWLHQLEAGKTPAEALRYAVSVGAANALSVGGAQFSITDVDDLLPQAQLQKL